jgi:hypothetical protein
VRKLALVLATMCALTSIACTRIEDDKDELLAAVYRTETQPRSFTYAEVGDEEVEVTGTIADDYRYGVDATIDGRDAASEVVVDDARAIRITDARLRTTIAGAAPPRSVDALAAKDWVLDPKGSATLFDKTPRTLQNGADPLHDGLEALRYVRRAVGEAAGVLTFNPDSQDYRPKFDPFEPPREGEIRYDVVPPALTPRDPTTSVGNDSQLPGVRFFRRMSVYVDADEGGVITEVRERISVLDMLNDPRSRLAARIGDYNITLPSDVSTEEQASYLATVLRDSAQRLGQPPVRVRDLTVTFETGSFAVELPKGATRASLKGVRDHGQILFEKAE